MCGLVGVITKGSHGFTTAQRDAFDLLLWTDTWRGDDSTGVFMVDNIGNVKMVKDEGYAPRFMASKEYNDVRNEAFRHGWAMIGHNRKATRGSITDENAHPFIVDDNIVLVHNGSYNGSHKGLRDVEVDSLAIAHTISEAESPEEALRKVNAAYALIWYNADKKELNLIRNSQRPLWVVECKNEYVIASEEAFIALVALRCKLETVGVPKELEEHVLKTFSLDDKSTTVSDTKLDCSYWKHNPAQQTGGSSHVGLFPFPSTPRAQISNAAAACGYDEAWAAFNEGVRDAEEHPLVSPFDDDNEQWERFRANMAGSSCDLPTPIRTHVNTKSEMCAAKIMDTIKDTCNVVTFADFQKLREEHGDGTRVKVRINDLVEADDVPKSKNWLLIGKPLVNHKMYATFHMTEADFQKVVASSNDAVYDIEVDGVTWRRTESRDTKKKMEEWMGVVIIHGKNPVPVVLGESGNA